MADLLEKRRERKRKAAERARAWRITNPEKVLLNNRKFSEIYRQDPLWKRRHHLKYRYGLSLERFKDLEAKQSGTCAICQRKPQGSLHVDHDHTNGNIRGLLCDTCNRGIGYFQDNAEWLQRAAIYLTRPVDA